MNGIYECNALLKFTLPHGGQLHYALLRGGTLSLTTSDNLGNVTIPELRAFVDMLNRDIQELENHASRGNNS